jgi:pimeloyl-ACP methyl ester carboxylesterase
MASIRLRFVGRRPSKRIVLQRNSLPVSWYRCVLVRCELADVKCDSPQSATVASARAVCGSSLISQKLICGSAGVSDFVMASDKPPLVLLHPFLLSGNVWQDVVPLVSVYHQVFTPTLLGHCGGPPVQSRPVTIWDVIDAAEHYLDEHGLQQPHLAGNSTGGFVALELARRGRAETVCALSPAGFWSTEDGSKARSANKVHRIAAVSRLSRPVGP